MSNKTKLKMKAKNRRREFSAEFSFDDVPKTKRKSWSIHDLKNIRALTENQALAIDHYRKGKNLGLFGCAGTGKTILAMNLALQTVLMNDGGPKRIILIRSAVQSREQGFLPGDIEQKMALYEPPYKDVFAFLLNRPSSYDDMKAAKIVEFTSTSFLRGLTFDDAVIVFDECQNALFREIDTVITRIGKNSRLILLGDTKQDDLSGMKSGQPSGLPKALKILQKMDGPFGMVEFGVNDIVRSALARDWIRTCHELAA